MIGIVTQKNCPLQKWVTIACSCELCTVQNVLDEGVNVSVKRIEENINTVVVVGDVEVAERSLSDIKPRQDIIERKPWVIWH